MEALKLLIMDFIRLSDEIVSYKHRSIIIMMKKNTGMNRGSQSKIALINDFCGFGRCSLTVSIPIISAMGIQACPVPTAIFSNHTAYDSFYKHDMTSSLDSYIDEWRKLGLSFHAVLAGYLSSPRQIGITREFVSHFLSSEGIFILDPVMGDKGRLYSSYGSDMLMYMKELTGCSDVLTPNLTEACFLTDNPYESIRSLRGAALTERLNDIAANLSAGMRGGHGLVVISGIESEHYIGNYVFDHDFHKLLKTKKSGVSRCGTGDIFSAVISASLMQGSSLEDATALASRFIRKCISVSDGYNIPLTDGVAFEDVLRMLIPHVSRSAQNNH